MAGGIDSMHLDFRNLNTLWASVVAESLYCLGLTTVVICPGSRSTPLTIAFAQHRALEAIPILDERSAAFFALGIAKCTGNPVVLVCTSGTAGANFYPAVIEAQASRVPLIIITADRPPQLRHCHAGQTIDQLKLYGNYPNWQTEIALANPDIAMLRYLRQTMIQAWERSQFPFSGVVHLNFPLSEPLAPIAQPQETLPSASDLEDFFTGISPLFPSPTSDCRLPTTFHLCQRGIIIAGVAHTHEPQEYCQAIADLSQSLQFPVLAEALSPLRNYADLNPALIATYDLILRNPSLAQALAPEIVIQIGELPTSKELRTWLDAIDPPRWIIDPSPENFDPLHGKTRHLRTSIASLMLTISAQFPLPNSQINPYLKQWCEAEGKVRQAINQVMPSLDFLLEGKAAWLLSQALPQKTPIFIANSMPIRDAEFFWLTRQSEIIPYFNRGANGIDGTLSSALGIAHHHPRSCVMLTGDLALLHDTNGFLIREKFIGHLTIVLINNNGGGIFEMLPIVQSESFFEEFFATPQNIDFSKLCATYGIEHKLISDWQQLQDLLNPLPKIGIRVLEVPTNRKFDALWLKDNLNKFAEISEFH